ncbi:non-ribosomal peptide synthetase, partial [Janthinobacterium sp. PSPC1-1]|uniref:non-ribosomal peptide synthetase n=1 Tax=Janthinobacterium sp. PSPC1-1 TaxID=2804581 RepID=UPI003CF4A951
TDVRTIFGASSLRGLAQALDAQAPEANRPFAAPPNLIPASCTHITPEMLPLVALSQQEIDTLAALVPGGAANIQDIYPLAPLQEGILFHHLMAQKNDPYIMSMVLRIKDGARLDAFLAALQAVVDRHDVLRTAVMAQQVSVPVQVVHRQACLQVKPLVLAPGGDIETQLGTYLAQPQSMDLARAPLMQVSVAAGMQSNACYLLLQLHHIISDHLGLAMIQDELMAHMHGEATGLAAAVPYREFVAHGLYQARHQNAEVFFRTKLADVTEPTAPFGLVAVHGDGSRIKEVRQELDPALARQIRTATKQHSVSTAALFHAAWARVLAACAGKEDVVFGTVFSGRLQGTPGAHSMLGMFINLLPLRLKLSGQGVLQMLRQTEAELGDLLPYEQASLTLAQRCSALPVSTPLFSSMLNYRRSEVAQAGSRAEMAGVELLASQERTNYPLTLSIDDMDVGFALDLQLDDSVDAARVLGYMEAVLAGLSEALLVEPDKAVLDVAVLPAGERAYLLQTLNATQANYPQEHCIHELFEAQVARTPAQVALVYGDEQLTYAQLNARANQLAHALRARGVGPDVLVGLCVERSLEMMVGVLAILKAGGAYVPLDPAYPQERLAYMAEDSGLALIVTQQALLEKAGSLVRQAGSLQLLCLDDGAGLPYDAQNLARLDGHGAASLAYVIYTSGSTGKPKGVMVEHGNVLRLFAASAAHFHFNADDVWTLFHSYGFDFSVWEMWGPLLHGGRLLVVPYWISRSPADFHALLVRERVTILNQTPSAFAALMEVDQEHPAALALRCVIFGGEALQASNLAPWVARHGDQRPQLVNMYGITETTVHVTYRRLLQADVLDTSGASDIGRPLADLGALVLTPRLELAPFGVVGELYVGGAGLARGYLHRPELTAERFIANPYHEAGTAGSSARLYKTGDLVRYLADG